MNASGPPSTFRPRPIGPGRHLMLKLFTTFLPNQTTHHASATIVQAARSRIPSWPRASSSTRRSASDRYLGYARALACAHLAVGSRRLGRHDKASSFAVSENLIFPCPTYHTRTQPKRIEKAKILIANTSMDTDKIKIFGSRVRVDSMQKARACVCDRAMGWRDGVIFSCVRV